MIFLLGPLEVEISGDHPVRALIEQELTLSGASRHGSAMMEIQISSEPPAPMDGVQLSGSRLELRHSVSHLEGVLRVSTGIKRGPTLYTVDIAGDLRGTDPVRVVVYLAENLATWARFVSPVTRIVSRDSSTLLEIAAKNVIYEIIDTLAAYRLPIVDAALLHSSALARNGRAVVLAGTGGVGKSTSLLAAMAQDPSWSYMSDDMVVVESDGTISRHPKRIQVYAYNVDKLPGMRATVMSHMSPWNRRLWMSRSRVLGPKQARIRLSADELFGSERVAEVGQLGSAVWIRPAPKGEPSVDQLDAAELGRRASVALVDEVWDFARLLNLGSLLTRESISVAEFQTDVESVLATAFSAVPCYELTIPYGADPQLLLSAFTSVVDW